MYQRIVFVQGSDAQEPLEILARVGMDAAVACLAQWDLQAIEGNEFEEAASGDSDDVYESDNVYRMSWNGRVGYIGLERIIN